MTTQDVCIRVYLRFDYLSSDQFLLSWQPFTSLPTCTRLKVYVNRFYTLFPSDIKKAIPKDDVYNPRGNYSQFSPKTIQKFELK